MHPDQLTGLPYELRKLPQWVCGDAAKRPINPATGKLASVTKPATWGTFAKAVAAAKRYKLPQVGFVLTADDPFCIVDLDDKADSPATDAEREAFERIIESLDSYTERSQSGSGYHVIVKATLAKAVKTAHVEIYDRARYMICTGDKVRPEKVADAQKQIDALIAEYAPRKAAPGRVVATVPSPVRLDAEVLSRCEADHGSKFVDLRAGEWRGEYPTESEARFALLGMLARHSADDAQVLHILAESPLGQSAKAERLASQELEKIRATLRDEDSAVSLFSDLANAQRIAHHMRADLMFAPGIGWHVWNGNRWKCDPLEARRIAQRLGRLVIGELPELAQRAQRAANEAEAERLRELAEKLVRHGGQVENVQKMEAAMKAAEPLMRVDVHKLDADPLLLGCENGALDLHTGELLSPEPALLITRSTGVAFDPAAQAPTWLAFLNRIFRKHPDLVPFVQRLAGYWLTGRTDPALLAVLHGVGANGKSTFTSALMHALGDYATAAPPRLLMATYGERHPTELAALQGRRLVVAAESGEGGRLDEEKIKMLTGSDVISARRMREDLFTFQPTHKLALMTNHKPSVRGTDEGIWRRLLLVPFDEVIPENERDPMLGDKLRDEAPGILAWAVAGCIAFLHTGLQPPSIVADATRAYRNENDILGEFLDDECEDDATAVVTSAELYVRYETWAEECGERALSKKLLGLRLQERGYEKHMDRRGVRGWKGLRLKQFERPTSKATRK